MHIHDVIGIGFGPSNIALAVALDEQRTNGEPMDMLFIEKQPSFAWHGDMLLDNSHMQISFLKDLATLRNPSSRFTFLNYLHEKRRLQDFINLRTFYPSRQEFNDYLGWAAQQFEDQCAYGEEVLEVLPEMRGDRVALLRVRSRVAGGALRERLARNLVVSVGGTPHIPPAFAGLRGDPRVFHSSRYLGAIAAQPLAQQARVAVVGAGQSATEIFLDLHGRSAGLDVDFIMRGHTIKPSDSSPFVNEIFNPEYTDYVFNQTEDKRAALIDEFMQTNYAAPDLALIEQVYQVFYEQKVAGRERHRLLRSHEVESARADANGIHLGLLEIETQRRYSVTYDAVVLGTGYRRQQHKALLEPLASWLPGFAAGRDYRLHSEANFEPAIFLQGGCEPTHGLSDTLLSVTAIRTDEIGQALSRAGARAADCARQKIWALASH